MVSTSCSPQAAVGGGLRLLRGGIGKHGEHRQCLVRVGFL